MTTVNAQDASPAARATVQSSAGLIFRDMAARWVMSNAVLLLVTLTAASAFGAAHALEQSDLTPALVDVLEFSAFITLFGCGLCAIVASYGVTRRTGRFIVGATALGVAALYGVQLSQMA